MMATALVVGALLTLSAAITRRQIRALPGQLARVDQAFTEWTRTRDEAEFQSTVDLIGLDFGVAPSGTAGLGEHVLVPGFTTEEGVADPDGGFWFHLDLHWPDAVWFDENGVDTHRDLSRFVEAAESLPIRSNVAVDVGRKYLVPFRIEHLDGDLALVPAAQFITYADALPTGFRDEADL